MHIPDGILPPVVTIPCLGVTVAATAYCIHKVNQDGDPREHVPKTALLSAGFFVLSSVQIPVPPASVHLILGGLMGVMLGYFALPAILVALFFQAVMFGHGGLTTLGVNAIILGVPALLAGLIFRLHKPSDDTTPRRSATFAFTAGTLATALSVGLFVGFLFYSIPSNLDVAAERSAILALAAAHIPLVIIEGVVTAFIVLFLRRNRPQLLTGT